MGKSQGFSQGECQYINDELLLDTLWVSEKFRKQSIGSTLIQSIDLFCQNNHITTIFTDTYSFQAKDFYLKNGFNVIGTIEGYLNGHSKIFLKKEIPSLSESSS